MENKKKKPIQSQINHIQEHYFIGQKSSRKVILHQIARLYWLVYLTCDITRQDPYELTKMLGRQQNVIKDLLQRNFGRAPRVLKGFLEFLNRHQELFKGKKSRLLISSLAKDVNAQGGVCLLDYWTEEQVMRFLDARLRYHRDVAVNTSHMDSESKHESAREPFAAPSAILLP